MSLEADVAQHAAFSAQCLGEQKPRRALNRQRRGMELHKLHVRQNRTRVIGDGHAVAGGDFGIRRLAIDLAYAARCQQHRVCMQFVQRTVGFVDKAQPAHSAALRDQFRRERVRAQVQVRDRMRAREQRPADFAARRVSLSVQNPRAAVRGFTRER